MTTEQLPWDKLNSPHAGFTVVGVDPDNPQGFFWGKDSRGNFLLLLKIEDAYEEFFKKNDVSLKGIKTDLRIHQSGEKFYILSLQNNQNADIFLRLCEDLIECVKGAVNKLEALKLLLSRLKRWKLFLSHEKGYLLSKIEVQGLFSELKFIEECIDQEVVATKTLIEAWKGPLDGPQDFLFGDFAVEIKSIAGMQKNLIKISSENQLVAPLERLFIQVYFLGEFHDCEKGLSLNQMVHGIKEKLKDQELIQLLERRLDNAGYIELKNYDTPCYQVARIRKYEVKETFPRITPENIQEGISSVTYSISLDSINEFLFDSSYWEMK